MKTKLKTLGAVIALSVGVMTGAAVLLHPGPVAAQEIYGSQLMTEQERMTYRTKMQTATTAQERERIRLEHHNEMQVRARQQGMTLPDTPPAQGMGQGMSKGMDQGMGQGTGAGQGPGAGGGGKGGKGN